MNKEEYEDRGFPFRDFLLKLILIVIIAFLLWWFVPKFISMNKSKCSNGVCSVEKAKKSSKSFSKDMKSMKKAGISYFTEDNLPKNDGESVKLTLEDMISKNIIKTFNDENKYNYKKSYIEIIKETDDYVLKIKLVSNKKSDSKTVYLNHYDYCENYLCERDESKENNDDLVEDNSYVSATGTTKTITKKNGTKTIKKKSTKGYKYKYIKNIKAKFSKWSSWSKWTVTDCSTKKVSCSDDSITCLKKVQRYDDKKIIGYNTKKYVYPKIAIKLLGSRPYNVSSSGIYVVVDNKLYKASSKYEFVLVEKNKEFSSTPNDNLYYHYEFVSGKHYDVYKYNGTLTEVTNNSSSNPITVIVPVYGSTTINNVEYVKEPVYKTTCYQSSKTRSLISKGKTLIKWSKYNDTSLLKNGWVITNTRKKI